MEKISRQNSIFQNTKENFGGKNLICNFKISDPRKKRQVGQLAIQAALFSQKKFDLYRNAPPGKDILIMKNHQENQEN